MPTTAPAVAARKVAFTAWQEARLCFPGTIDMPEDVIAKGEDAMRVYVAERESTITWGKPIDTDYGETDYAKVDDFEALTDGEPPTQSMLVIGIYMDNDQPFAQTYDGRSAGDAIAQAQADTGGKLRVAAVIVGNAAVIA